MFIFTFQDALSVGALLLIIVPVGLYLGVAKIKAALRRDKERA